MKTETIQSNTAMCLICKHFDKYGRCIAFTNGIPNEILSGDNKHEKPMKDQGNDIVFEPIDK